MGCHVPIAGRRSAERLTALSLAGRLWAAKVEEIRRMGGRTAFTPRERDAFIGRHAAAGRADPGALAEAVRAAERRLAATGAGIA